MRQQKLPSVTLNVPVTSVIAYTLQILEKWSSFVKIILLNKTCRDHEHLFATELIFCENPKSVGKIPLGF